MSLDKTKTKTTLPTPKGLGLSDPIDVAIVLECVIRQLGTVHTTMLQEEAPLRTTCKVSLAQTLLKEALEALEEMENE